MIHSNVKENSKQRIYDLYFTKKNTDAKLKLF